MVRAIWQSTAARFSGLSGLALANRRCGPTSFDPPSGPPLPGSSRRDQPLHPKVSCPQPHGNEHLVNRFRQRISSPLFSPARVGQGSRQPALGAPASCRRVAWVWVEKYAGKMPALPGGRFTGSIHERSFQFSPRESPLISTPLQRGVGTDGRRNRFNGFSHRVETVETVSRASGAHTPR